MRVSRPARVRASIAIPPDKSISHRSLIFNAIAEGSATIEGILDSEDVRSTARCLAELGVPIDWPAGSSIARVTGQGLHGIFESDNVLDCGNSGTTMRLLMGLLAGHPLLSVLTGDASLRSRPMARVIHPLREMGATLYGRRGDTLAPVVIKGGRLRGMRYATPVASAQVKSAILLAGLYAETETTVIEPERSRDHTERLLDAMGASIRRVDRAVTVHPAERLEAISLRVPGDISSAAPWMVLAACHPDAEVVLRGVNVNPTRTGIVDILRAMGANIECLEERATGGEPVADLVVRSSSLRGTTVSGDLVPRAIDELPLIALAATTADGVTVVRDATELRVKESDRVKAVVETLGRMGADIHEREDGFEVRGPTPLRGARLDAHGDHRIGMLAAIAGCLADGETMVLDDAVGVSYREFWEHLRQAAPDTVSP
ncbi:3-phosphoshikimate 1-carboxyvinyltransferase [Tepidiforma sp.]|uniref:3-phosphoshikimate 1-carboxyvinyltransferase n=1 Tax=Tepidiforma sp. TaxID=2682230 RepID=UPI002ADE6ABF|nr:3-phosphoshikimate 1-carboxyvinyltransferase [Tepidiforma sp.]